MKTLLKKLPTLYERTRLRARDFIIISNNCWGFECYKTLNREYNTPFVGLFVYPADYLKLVKKIELVSSEPLRFLNSSRYQENKLDYPVGVILDDVEIHFLHFNDEDEARKKWKRRVDRMEESLARGAELIFKFCDRDGCNESDLEAFHSIPVVQEHKKVSFGVSSLEIPNHICVNGSLSESGEQVVDGLRLYNKRYKSFDFAEWVVSGNVQSSIASRLLRLLQ